MGDGYEFVEIFVLALLAGFLVLRLRSVLGRRTGAERRRTPVPVAEPGAEKVVLSPASREPPAASEPAPTGLAAVKAADRSFDEQHFLAGARGAFEIIVNAFAKGDSASLQPLLSEAVFNSFKDAIRARRAAGETQETNLLAIKSIELAGAAIDGTTASLTVRFVSDQTNVTRGADGSVIDGDADHVVEKTDLWTFARSVRSRDPNWTLVATALS